MSYDIDPVAEYARKNGMDSIRYAEILVTAAIEVRDIVINGRAKNPSHFPAYGPDTSEAVAARRILAGLLNAGWKPPEDT